LGSHLIQMKMIRAPKKNARVQVLDASDLKYQLSVTAENKKKVKVIAELKFFGKPKQVL